MKSNFRSHKERLKMYEDNKALPYYAVKKFTEEFSGIIDEDLLAVAQTALWDVTDRFDETLGYKFSTYASKYMFGRMRNYLRDTRLIRSSRDKSQDAIQLVSYDDDPALENNLVHTDSIAYDIPTDIIEKAVPEHYRHYIDVLYMHAIERKSEKTIANMLNISQTVVSRRIQTVKHYLRQSEELKEWAGV